MGYIKSAALEETGFVVLDSYDREIDPKEWLEVEYVDWKSSGDTRFAPIASAKGEIECNGFWNHTPPRTDKDGVWIPSQMEKAPTLTERAQEPGANVGRCRIIELQPNSYADALYNLHQDDNNRLNPDGTGWVVRGFFNLTDDKNSYFVLRENRTDPSIEYRVALPAGAQLIVDTQRLWNWTRSSRSTTAGRRPSTSTCRRTSSTRDRPSRRDAMPPARRTTPRRARRRSRR